MAIHLMDTILLGPVRMGMDTLSMANTLNLQDTARLPDIPQCHRMGVCLEVCLEVCPEVCPELCRIQAQI
jgi:hypothetical protein